jgi:oligopeptidase B
MILKNFTHGAIALAAFVAFSCQTSKDSNTEITMIPPVASIQPETLMTHNDTRIDNYFWMRLSDEQKQMGDKDPQTKMVLDYLRAENEYTAQVMKHTESLQKKLYDEMVGRIDPTDESVPYKFNGYFYYSRFDEGKEYPYYCRKKESLSAAEEIMLDVPELAKPYSYYATGSMGVSPDNKILGYSEDTLSRRIYTLKFKNLETESYLPTKFPEQLVT